MTVCNASEETQHSALLQLLSNSLVLCHIAPYLSCFDVLSLAATSRTFRYLIFSTPQVFRRLDLTPVRTANVDIDSIDHSGQTWRNVRLDDHLTEDDFYSGSLRGIFSNLRRSDILRYVQILILDGLSVTAELVHDILVDSSFTVRILSIRDVKNLNERKLRAALQYACRESRPEGTPRLQGVYVFGAKDTGLEPRPLQSAESSPRTRVDSTTVGKVWNNRSQQALAAALVEEPEEWYASRGDQFPRRISSEWAPTLVACAGVIAFDAVLCRGPRHLNSPAWGAMGSYYPNTAEQPVTDAVPLHGIATYSLDGCASCGGAPEGWTVWGEDMASPERDASERQTGDTGTSDVGRFPLLGPPPLHSANVRLAMCPAGQAVHSRGAFITSSTKRRKAQFIPRCYDCLRDRHCLACNRWWCETCYWPLGAGIPAGGYGGAAHLVSSAQTNSSDSNTDTGESVNKNIKYKVRDGLCLEGDCWFRYAAERMPGGRQRASSVPRRRLQDNNML